MANPNKPNLSDHYPTYLLVTDIGELKVMNDSKYIVLLLEYVSTQLKVW